jgi:hypothetical protein
MNPDPQHCSYVLVIAFLSAALEALPTIFMLPTSCLFQEGTRWFGKCWHYHEQLKYEFDVEFDIPVTYPMTSPEIALPELDGKTAKVRRLLVYLLCVVDVLEPGPLEAERSP